MTDTTMNTGAASLSDERERAAITACALMIKGICLTRPNAEWTGAIEDRIQFMLKQMQAGAAIAAGGAQEPAEQDERGATIQEGWILVKKERIEAIRAATNVNLEESYRGRGLYEERTLIRNSHELETAIDAIKDELREMTECDPDELAEARAASTSANVAQLQSVDLPPRVIDQLYQAAGVSTYHPDGDQQEKLHAFARNVVAETLARLPTANVAQGAEVVEFEWPPLPTLPNQSFYAFDRALFTEHQMQGYANAYGEAVRAALAAPVAPAVDAQPVAWRHKATKILRNDSIAKGADFEPADWEPLYTAAQSEGLRKDACGKSAGNFLNCAPEGDKPHYLPVDEEYKENPDVVELFFDAARLNTKPERRMTDDDLMRLARKHEGTDPSDDIPQVFALTPLELSALAKDIRRVALEEAADLVESIREQIRDKSIIGFKAWAMGVGVLENASSHIRALSQKGPQ